MFTDFTGNDFIGNMERRRPEWWPRIPGNSAEGFGEMLNLLVAAVLALGLELELPLEINSLECWRAGTDRETAQYNQLLRASALEPDCD